MRVGVSAKVFLAYAVLLLAFATTAIFSVTSLHSARQYVVGHNLLLVVQKNVEDAWLQVELIDHRSRERRAPTLAGTYYTYAADSLAEARRKVEAFLAERGSMPARQEFEGYRVRIERLERLAGEAGADLIAQFERKEPATNPGPAGEAPAEPLGEAAAAGPNDPDGDEAPGRAEAPGEPRFSPSPALRAELSVFRNQLQSDSVRIAENMQIKEDRAVSMAIALGIAGLLGALGAALSVWRTLRPLEELRVRARRIAGGDYSQRIGLHSRDEIGDLAREFDGMAWALEEREQRLIRSERLATVGRVASQITHEIRNPLASIGLNAELLGDELGPDQGEGRRLLTAISGEVDRLSDITDTYLRYVRLPRPKLQREDLAEVVTAAMEFARAELAHAGVSLQLTVPAGLPPVMADENQLRQALLNLVRNAREAMPRGGTVAVELTGTAEGGVAIRVSDTGSGIPSEHQERIFEPFFSTKAEGTGLGLALVHQIIIEHGGRIEVRAADGAGTVFELTFPPASKAAVAPAGRTIATDGAEYVGEAPAEAGSGPSVAGMPAPPRTDTAESLLLNVAVLRRSRS
jgi:two-component system, NtrC family, sensor kinase